MQQKSYSIGELYTQKQNTVIILPKLRKANKERLFPIGDQFNTVFALNELANTTDTLRINNNENF